MAITVNVKPYINAQVETTLQLTFGIFGTITWKYKAVTMDLAFPLLQKKFILILQRLYELQ